MRLADREVRGEALTGGAMDQPLSRERFGDCGADAVEMAEGHTDRVAIARPSRTLRGLRPCARREGPRTEAGRSPVRLFRKGGAGRVGKSEDVRR